MIKSLTYVSRSSLPSTGRGDVLEAILSVARTRNRGLDVTGALISSCYTFAQLIEGPPASIDALMTSISRDNRHNNMRVISVKNETRRRFPNWSMAFSGNAHYIDRHIEILLDPGSPEIDRTNIDQLEDLMEEFSKRLN